MTLKRKVIAALTAFCLAAFSLTACGTEVQSNADVSRAEQTASQTQTTDNESSQSSLSDAPETTTTTTSNTTTTTTSQSTASETSTTTEKAVEASGSLETTTTTAASQAATSAQTTTKPAASAKSSTKASTKASQQAAAPKPAVPPAPTAIKPPAASSSNVKFYQDRVYVAGDSIAYGFCAYGYIPYEHNIAKGSLAMRNYTDAGWFNEFDVNGRTVKCMDAVIAKQPRLLYVSMGMNDVNLTSAQTYANNYVGFLKKVRANVPNCIIVAANITPIASFSSFTGINNIKNANAAMNAAVKAMNDPNIILFDAYSVVSGGGTYMASGYSAGDGIHLAGHVYQKLLNRLAIVLDQYSVKERLSA